MLESWWQAFCGRPDAVATSRQLAASGVHLRTEGREIFGGTRRTHDEVAGIVEFVAARRIIDGQWAHESRSRDAQPREKHGEDPPKHKQHATARATRVRVELCSVKSAVASASGGAFACSAS